MQIIQTPEMYNLMIYHNFNLTRNIALECDFCVRATHTVHCCLQTTLGAEIMPAIISECKVFPIVQ